MTSIELVKEYFPKATKDLADFILWEKTAFPFGDETYLRKQLQTLAKAFKLGRTVCDCCGKIKDKAGMKSYACKKCTKVVKQLVSHEN